jgi:hypothetical protein
MMKMECPSWLLLLFLASALIDFTPFPYFSYAGSENQGDSTALWENRRATQGTMIAPG